MTLIITPGMSPEEIHRHAREMRMGLKYDFTRLCGTIQLSDDPIVAQRRLRDEWE